MTRLYSRRRNQRGLTLLEILAVLAILALVMAVVAPAVISQIRKARSKAAVVQMEGIAQALNAYSLDCGGFPTTEQKLEALLEAPTVGKPCKNYSPEKYWDKKAIPEDP